MISPDAFADEPLDVDDAPSGPRRVELPHDPDEEALAIARRVAERVAVARSLARIAGHVVRAYADRKMQELVERDGDPLAKLARARQVAHAATEAAKHAARLAAMRAVARAEDVMAAAAPPDPDR